MACGCKGKQLTAAGAAAASGTYRVGVNGRQVYESSNKEAAEAVISRFDRSELTSPDGTVSQYVKGVLQP